jgi:hypothetical protein
MQQRKIYAVEQPHKLHAGLQKAVVRSPSQPAALRMIIGILEVCGVMYALRTLGFPIAPLGVPHGVTKAIVDVKNVKLEHWENGQPVLRFCETHSYSVHRETLTGGDGGKYPDFDNTFISVGCVLPDGECYGDARLCISINGTLDANIQYFEPKHAVAV